MGRVAALVRRRLGRPLEPFDIWYSGFRALGTANVVSMSIKRPTMADAL